jgi:hypothetical protein
VNEPRPRWDSDERRRGVADATAVTPYVNELLELVTTADWITEDPEGHLLPHIERAIGGERDARLTHHATVDGVLELDVDIDAGMSRQRMREVAHRLVASIAESVTLVRQVGDASVPTFEVVTGVVPAPTGFATHGHRLTIRTRRSDSR